QIERRHSTGAGEAIVIDRKELIAEADAGKLLPQRREILPMDGRPVLVEESRLRERVTPGAQRSERHPALGQPPQRRDNPGRDSFLDVDPTANEEYVDLAQPVEGHGRGELNAVA